MFDTDAPAFDVTELTYRYGPRVALDHFSVRIEQGELFAFLGPNGSGKTTLFRLLSTLLPLSSGTVRLLGFDLRSETNAAREQLGVVFQAPSVDRKLTVQENLLHHGRLYGLSGRTLRKRATTMLEQLGLTARRNDIVETLSGGLRRRVELAGGLLHEPRILLLDEPSTGLDPAARSDLWQYLDRIRHEQGVTVVLTTHLLDEADRADRIAILDAGKLVALDRPDALRATLGGDSITIETQTPRELAAQIRQQFNVAVRQLGETLRLEQPEGHRWIPQLVDAFGPAISSISLGKPTLADVFIARTGHRFWNEA